MMLKIFALFIVMMLAAPRAQAAMWYDKLPESGQSTPQPFGGSELQQPQQTFDNINSGEVSTESGVQPATGEAAATGEQASSALAESHSPPWKVIIVVVLGVVALAVWSWRKGRRKRP